MLVDELKESLSDICSDCFAEWRIEPDDFPTASSIDGELVELLPVEYCNVTL
jgi:hypothetical protein